MNTTASTRLDVLQAVAAQPRYVLAALRSDIRAASADIAEGMPVTRHQLESTR